MRLAKLPFCFAVAALFFLQFSAPTASYADTYQIVGLGIDNVQFYGMDDSGHVVFSASSGVLCGGYSVCYGSDANGWSGIAPALAYDNGSGCSITLPPGTSDLASVCNNGRDAFYGYESGNGGIEGLYSGSNPPQLITSDFFNLALHMNGNGDIVFDNGRVDEWEEAIDLSTVPVPEPTSILLLGTGAIAIAGIVTRRKRGSPEWVS